MAGTLAAAAWCLHRFQCLHREQVPRRTRAAKLRELALSWCTTGVVLVGASACAVTAAALPSAATRGIAAGVLYLGGCLTAFVLLAVVEGLNAAYRVQLAEDTAKKRKRRMSVRTLMRTAPHSESPL